MLLINLRNTFFIICLFLGISIFSGYLHADNSINENIKNNKIFSSSGLFLPRFVSLANDKTNVRAGPGKQYPIKWVLDRKSLPVEVILEYYNWRKVKDSEGQVGWVYSTLLSGKRTAIISGDDPVYSYKKPIFNNRRKSRVSMQLEPNVIVEIEECRGGWCNVFTSGYYGWVKIKSLWGVYESENID